MQDFHGHAFNSMGFALKLRLLPFLSKSEWFALSGTTMQKTFSSLEKNNFESNLIIFIARKKESVRMTSFNRSSAFAIQRSHNYVIE